MIDLTSAIAEALASSGREVGGSSDHLPQLSPAAAAPRSPADVRALVNESVRVSSVLARYARARYEPTQRERRVLRLAERAEAVDCRGLGLSNATYLAAPSGTQFLSVEVDSAEVRFRFSDSLSHRLNPVQGGGLRGEITEFSEASRSRLAARAWALTAHGHKPQAMLTLTAPANWERVYICTEDGEPLGGGRLLKLHLEKFRKRLDRFLSAANVGRWSALWFLEFQRRGAPHVHLLLYGCKVPPQLLRSLRSWCGPAWSEIVGNPSDHEKRKHERAGTRVEFMKAEHFGYAVKYANKTEQKEVPTYFRDVGRFWGCWNYEARPPLALEFDYNPAESGDVVALVGAALASLPECAGAWAARMGRRVAEVAQLGLDRAFSFRVFGSAAAAAVVGHLGGVT